MDGHGHRRMPRGLAGVAGLAAAGTLLAACGGSGPAVSDPGTSPLPAIATSSVSGVGTVLVDAAGKTLYFTDQDANGTIRCTRACVSFWFPATTSSVKVPPGSVAGLSVIKRPDDGKEQFAYRGRPLYEFKLDGMAGQVNGQDVHDRFGSTAFTWHAAVVAGTAASTASEVGSVSGY